MSDITNFKTAIYNLLTTLTDEVYSEIADDDANFPMITYRYIDRPTDYGLSEITLKVNIYDNDSNSTALENLTDSVKQLFDRQSITNSNITCRFYKTMINEPETQEKENNENVKHRQIVVMCRICFK